MAPYDNKSEFGLVDSLAPNNQHAISWLGSLTHKQLRISAFLCFQYNIN